jgi:uncharacterized SAM-binding protein YcdF (DUF218 family)
MDLIALPAAMFKAMVLPPACLFLLFGAGLVAWRRRPRLGKAVCGAAVGLLYFLCSGIGSWLLVHPLESLDPVLPSGPLPQAQAIVVLTAGRIRNSPEYERRSVPDTTALARMTYAAHVYRAHQLPLLVTGGLLSTHRAEEPLATSMKRVFENEFGIPVTWAETRSRNTAENARFSVPILKAAGIAHIILVTDAMHMRRARLAFEQQGIVVTPAPTFFEEPGGFNPLRILPTAENLKSSYYAVYEWLGLAHFMIAGR